jgi:hypothetical protein
MARGIVSRYPGVNPQDVEDLTQEILLKFIAKDFLEEYDPTKLFATPVGMRPARFATLFRSFVRKFLRTPVETRSRKADREPVRLEQPVQSGEMWIDVHAPADPDDETSLVDLRVELGRAYRHLATIHVNEDGRAETTLGEVFKTMADEGAPVGYNERVTRRRIAKAFGVSDTTVTRWVKAMRAELQAIGFPDGSYEGEGSVLA